MTPACPARRAPDLFQIADRGAEAGIPGHKALVAIEQPFLVKIDEYLEHRLREALVHREAFVGPIHRAAQPPQLLRDLAARFRLPFPLLVDELLARVIGALVLLERHLAFDHHLRRDAGVIGADNRSEEHTSELQSLMRISYAVFCLKKKTNIPK